MRRLAVILTAGLLAFFAYRMVLASAIIGFFGGSAVAIPTTPATILHHLTLALTGDTNSGSGGSGVSPWTDQSANHYSFTALGASPTVVANALNGHKGVAFASSGPQYLESTTNVSLANSALFSVYEVVKVTSISGSFPTFFNWSNLANSGQYVLGFQYGGSGSGWLFYNDYGINQFNTATVSITPGTYYYFAFIASATQLFPYINGVPQTPVTLTQQMTLNISGSMFLGTYNGSQFNLDGVLVELDVDNATDSSTQISEMNSYVSTTYANGL